MFNTEPLLSTVLKQDSVAVVIGLSGVTILAWLYLFQMAGTMGGMRATSPMVMTSTPAPWSMADARIMFAMWWIMMVGMMLPSAAPMILTFATINRKKRERSQPYVPTTIFALGYLTAWGAFSVFATAAQWGLQQAALLSPMLIANNVYLAGALFVCAGLYQWTPFKHLCLKNCRSPLNYIINSWRNGRRGAFVMGWQHGLYCLGCCWLVMGLLFAIGIMNLVWVATIATFVFLEKLFPRGEVIARISGVLMTAFGAYLVVTG